MKIALLCVLIVVTGGTDGFHLPNAREYHKETGRNYKELGQRILLRKLQTFQRDDPKKAKTATWNQILADALVNRIKIFSFNKETTKDLPNDVGTMNSILTSCISEFMRIYKTFIYDKFYTHIDTPIDSNVKDAEHSILGKEINKVQNDEPEINFKTENVFENPKHEVEVIEPRYHGKLCDNCAGNTEKDATENEVENVETAGVAKTGCPVGLVASGGRCVDSKSKFILSIPYQCPIGYRRDWLGNCRARL